MSFNLSTACIYYLNFYDLWKELQSYIHTPSTKDLRKKLLERRILGETLTVKERDPYLCAAGSFFFPGLGQVYCGRILRGVIFLIPAVILTFPYFIISWYAYLDYYDYWRIWWPALQYPISKVIDLIVRVVATYDAYRVAKHTHIQQ